MAQRAGEYEYHVAEPFLLRELSPVLQALELVRFAHRWDHGWEKSASLQNYMITAVAKSCSRSLLSSNHGTPSVFGEQLEYTPRGCLNIMQNCSVNEH